jgi:transmembrane sensor
MNYSDFSEEDFILDESFIRWVKSPTGTDTVFWENWLRAHPEKRETVENAARFIRSLSLQENVFSDTETEAEWQAVQATLSQPNKNHRLPQPLQRWFTPTHWKIAATLTGILFVSLIYWLVQGPDTQVRYATAYGETRTVLLPDSSEIILNANSTLRFAANWPGNQTREVWLEGEAFLNVRHGGSNRRFIVRTGTLDVEVLGTQFNVNNRRGNVRVVLSSGKVKLNRHQTDQPADMYMEPGDLVDFSENAVFTRKKVDPEVFTSWRKNKIFLNDLSVQEISQLIEDTYGLTVQIKDPSLYDRKLSGEIMTTDVQVLLDVIAETLDIRVTRRGKYITLE